MMSLPFILPARLKSHLQTELSGSRDGLSMPGNLYLAIRRPMRTFPEGTILSLWGNRDWPVAVQTFREGQSLVWLSIASRVTAFILSIVNAFIQLDNVSYSYPGRQGELIPALQWCDAGD